MYMELPFDLEILLSITSPDIFFLAQHSFCSGFVVEFYRLCATGSAFNGSVWPYFKTRQSVMHFL